MLLAALGALLFALRPQLRAAGAGARHHRLRPGRLLHVGGEGDLDLDRAQAPALGAGLPDRGGRPGRGIATMPVRALLQHTDWRGLFVLLAVLIACQRRPDLAVSRAARPGRQAADRALGARRLPHAGNSAPRSRWCWCRMRSSSASRACGSGAGCPTWPAFPTMPSPTCCTWAWPP
jgi:hypothetical protein